LPWTQAEHVGQLLTIPQFRHHLVFTLKPAATTPATAI